jgi:SAM-dependent methyltransferase
LDETIEKKVEKLEKKRKWYQSVEIGDVRTIPESDLRAFIRTESVMKFIPQILKPNDRVLDVGCNAGLHSLSAAQYCKEVVGVDVSKDFIEQAEFLKSVWSKDRDYVSKVSFKVSNVLEDLETVAGFTVIFALKVLYHPGFIEGIHDFMSTIQQSQVRAILAQGHVTYPKYGSISSMDELFDQYGFKTVVLENIPEYPIVIAIRKDEKLSKKVQPVIGASRHIQYYPDYKMEDNFRCKAHLARLNGEQLDFDKYREIFERCIIEVGIMRGTLGSVQPVPLAPASIDETDFARKMGQNKHSEARVDSAIEFFDLYEKYGEKEFLKQELYKQTQFWSTISKGNGTLPSKILKVFSSGRDDRKRIMPLLQMYKNMKVIRDLVPRALDKKIKYSVYHPEDFPWSINYFGYIKKRDGSHRRMIMKYFGATLIDEIVVDFEKIAVDDLSGTIPYLINNFEWFYNEVLTAKRELNSE